ncbi:SusC/RagA family TonB-linked outer membrane protein [Alistipes sp.]|uniref:SusC/RagA family TonB-linked outer membrane protein n=1 Tax=Alistipes sp. TaxID=1872444 RepID=UPI003AF138D2
MLLNGIVLDESGAPMAGVTVVDSKNPSSGTTTGAKGTYNIIVSRQCDSLRFSFVGYKPQTVGVRDAALIRMQPDAQDIGEVVVTGIFTRKAESYTGAATTISKSEITRVGNQNLLQSLKNLDPTIYMPDNMTMGSDPNTLPTISMRGTTSFPAESNASAFKSNYQNQPNQPLFILDGFETSVETVMDMDMNRVESMTILKDAAAKALYGSKAANGVIVIETKRLMGNEQRITYTGSVSIEAPDLTSYNLCNSLEKLQVEIMEGVYDDSTVGTQIDRLQLYNKRRKLALEGLNTYWLSKPLETGVGHKHNLSVELGNAENLRAILDVSYNDVSGVMKGSGRTTVSGNANVSYRTKRLIFRNIMSIISNKREDSPYGSFADYGKMNPYWQATDSKGNVLRWAEGEFFNSTDKIPNPMYDAMIGTSLTSSYLKFTNNFYAEWQIIDPLKVTARIGVSQQRDDADSFYPAAHSMFVDYTAENLNRRGKYILESGKSSTISGDLNFNFNRKFDKHFLFANAGAFLSETNYSDYTHTAEGFPNNQKADITFARQYAEGSKPVGYATLNREISFLAAISYDYDNRFLVDATYRIGASSLYGKDNRWASSWSVGAGWNLHNEPFLRDAEILQKLKIRGSVGLTGNQNFTTNNAIATYKYYTGVNYQGQTGAYLSNMPNPQLRWEQKLDYNLGVELEIQNLKLTADYYIADTENMLTDVTIPTSTGFGTVKDNLGKVRNSGVELQANYAVWRRPAGFVNLFGSFTYNRNEIIRLSESLKARNKAMREIAQSMGTSTPVAIYEDGQSMKAIWAVPSAGIDPMTGNEVYIKKDGTLTYKYDSSDLIIAGDSEPKYRGTFGFTAEYKGIGLSATCTYLAGGQMYNYTLVGRVENIDVEYNVDRRVLLGRWQRPGQLAQFKKLTGTYKDENDNSQPEVTRPTTRFVQNRNELTISSISAYYEFPSRLIRPLRLKRLRATFYINNVATFSSIEIERGLTYPFARSMSFSLTATF